MSSVPSHHRPVRTIALFAAAIAVGAIIAALAISWASKDKPDRVLRQYAETSVHPTTLGQTARS